MAVGSDSETHGRTFPSFCSGDLVRAGSTVAHCVTWMWQHTGFSLALACMSHCQAPPGWLWLESHCPLLLEPAGRAVLGTDGGQCARSVPEEGGTCCQCC